MKKLLSRWARRIALLLALPIGLVLFGIGYFTFKVATYEQLDDTARMQSKQLYLEQIAATASSADLSSAPDVVVILFDDLGYGDVGYTGNGMIKTPHIDGLAQNGVVLDTYYAPSPVCSPSRAAMLTGRLAPRNGLTAVPFPSGHFIDRVNKFFGNPVRLPREEILLADVLRAQGFHTAMVGKWHMGDHDQSIPTQFGFEKFFGTYHSNDMTPFQLHEGAYGEGESLAVAAPVDQTQLNEIYGDKAEAFIAAAPKDKPMFLYFAHNFPHVPLYAPAEEQGRSQAGLYGDVVQGLDDAVGRIVTALKKRGRFDNTLIVITSDNGPWWEGRAAGNGSGARGRKGETFDGGMHVPFVAHWPAQLKPLQTSAMAMGTDLLPTLLQELDIAAPTDRLLDGRSLSATLRGDASPHEALYFYGGGTLMAVRDARYKYRDRKAVVYATDPISIPIWQAHGPWVFDMQKDPQEAYDITNHQPATAERLRALLDARNAEMAANPRGWK